MCINPLPASPDTKCNHVWNFHSTWNRLFFVWTSTTTAASHLDPYGSVIHDLHIYHSTPCLPSCIHIAFNFSWEDCNTQEKWKTKVCEILGAGKVFYGRCTNGKYIFNLLCAFATNLMLVLSFTWNGDKIPFTQPYRKTATSLQWLLWRQKKMAIVGR